MPREAATPAVPRTFPKMEYVFQPENTEPFLRRVEKTCKQLSDIAAKGTPAERERAAAALTAFHRAVDLVKEIAETRFRLAAEATSAAPRR
ncbi:MAG: hypothetical protein NTW28_09490 [Candidatus Solibacter sp.]|nr:hypothetical protein [Candidatus Solibacter sp.]